MDNEKKQREYDDDGHVIADMNVEGMPWYRKKQPWDNPNQAPLNLSKKETFYAIMGMIKASLLVGGAFIGAYLLFVLFCYFIWWR